MSDLSRHDLRRHSGAPDHLFGVRLVTLDDGAARGTRVLEMRSGSGLSFDVIVDRGFDIGRAEYRGMPIGWSSPTGIRNPSLHRDSEEGGLAWLRSFSGLLTTAGLDHIMGPETAPGDHFGYPGRQTIDHPLHGRIANLPATLAGYGTRWDGDRAVLWCEGRVVQAAVFGEQLELVRRIEVAAGSNRIVITDRVVNRGFRPTPHMMLYHVNIGWPVLDEGARFVAPVNRILFASHADTLHAQGVGWRTLAGPRSGFVEQVFEHQVAGDAAGRTVAALVNRRRGVAVAVEYPTAALPCLFEWQALEEGIYGFAIEPATNHAGGRALATERGELIRLTGGEERRYDLAIEVVTDEAALDALEAGAASAPDEFAPPAGLPPTS